MRDYNRLGGGRKLQPIYLMVEGNCVAIGYPRLEELHLLTAFLSHLTKPIDR